MELCKHCGVELTGNNWLPSCKDYGRRLCRLCANKKTKICSQKYPDKRKTYREKWYSLNREDHLKKVKLLRQKIRLQALQHYSEEIPKCACCGETHLEFLTIDHIDGKGNEHRRKFGLKSSSQFFYWLRDNNYPQGFRVLCMNCNFSLGKYGYCPHKF